MKTRKTVIAVLTAVALISAALIVGCMSQLDGLSDKDGEGKYQIPAGKGVVRIRFANSKARTILPVPDLESYTYDLLITKGGITKINEQGLSSDDFKSGGDFAAITLDEGVDYKISLIAYNTSGDPVGGYNNGNAYFEIKESEETELTASLTAKQEGHGTFTYTVTEATNGDTTIDIFDITGTTSIGDGYYGAIHYSETADFPITVSGTESDTITLDSGYYLVKITATSATTQTVQYVHVLHIYDNMESEWEQDLSAITLAKDRFTVTYHLPETDTSSLYIDGETSSIYYGTVLTARTYDPGDGSSKPGPAFAVNGFGGWYTKSNYSGDQFIMGTSRVFDTLDLYAKANIPGSATGDLAITIDFDYLNDPADISYSGDVSKADFFAVGGEITVTATGLTGTITWSIGGNTVASNSATLIINNSATFAKYLAGDVLVVNVLDSDNHSKSITIPLTD